MVGASAAFSGGSDLLFVWWLLLVLLGLLMIAGEENSADVVAEATEHKRTQPDSLFLKRKIGTKYKQVIFS